MNTACVWLILISIRVSIAIDEPITQFETADEDLVMDKTIDQQLTNASAPRAFDSFMVSSNGDILIKTELDILMPLDRFKKLYQFRRNSRQKRKGFIFTDEETLWHGRVIYYKYLGNTKRERNVIQTAIAHVEKYTCLKFVETYTAPHRVEIQYGNGCSTHVGRMKEPQELLMHSDCISVPSLIHEFGHTVGFLHEHQRTDRDTYISVNYDKVPSQHRNNFDKWPMNSYGIPYDYTSVMHYGDLGGILTTLDRSYQDKIGKSPGFSFKDIKLASLMYNCSSWYCTEKKECPFNGFVFFKAFKGAPKCECWCDSGNVNDPLVLCSSIDKEFPAPILPARSTLRQTNASGCNDMRDNCEDLKEEGLCRTDMIMMYSRCARTCNFCGKGKDLCMDLEDGCGMMAASGACQEEGLSELMGQLCPKSCGLCVTISAPCEIEFSLLESPEMLNDSGVFNRIGCIIILPLLFVASCFCM